MSNIVRLDNVEHHDLRVALGYSQTFGDAVNEVPVLPTEFAELQREYPIYFRRDDQGRFQAHALLGFDKDENLFLADGVWNARYVPAMLDRGPFLIGRSSATGLNFSDLSVMVDMDHPRITSDGDPIFKPHGGNTPRLERYLHALRLIHQGAEVSQPMFDAFIEAGLIAPVNIDIRLDDRTEYKLPDVFSISRDALVALDGPQLEALNRKGFLALAFHVVASVGNIPKLIEMENQRRAAV